MRVTRIFPELDDTWVTASVEDFASQDSLQLPFSVVRYVKRSRFIDVSKARNTEQREQLLSIESDDVCPFCDGNLDTYHTKRY